MLRFVIKFIKESIGKDPLEPINRIARSCNDNKVGKAEEVFPIFPSGDIDKCVGAENEKEKRGIAESISE